MDELINKTLDHYQVAKLLGEGGMGAVYKGIDLTLQRDVAIKVMHPHIARAPNFRERFLQEARIAARMHHPNIVQVYDFGQEGGMLYIVMQFIQGKNLEILLRNLRSQGKWIPLDEGLLLIRQVALALDYVHKHGVMHRDIKPGNVMISPEPCEGLTFQPVLTDLGLAKLAEGGMATQEGTSMGTPAYMSPEQASGQAVDSRSDVYSVGVLLYELCVGQLPFPAKTLSQALHYHVTQVPPAPRSLRPDLPLAVEGVILKALQKKPSERFSDGSEFAKAIDECLRGSSFDLQAAPTEANTMSLMTEYQKSLVEERGASVLDEFKTPTVLREDLVQVLGADKSVREIKIKAGGLTIGRALDNDIVLPDPKVSKHHARIAFAQGEYQVIDLDSTNGTYLVNARLLPGIPEKWTPDQTLRIGEAWLRLLLARKTSTSTLRRQGTMVDSNLIPAGSVEGRVGLFIEDTQLTVEPGQCITIPISLLNQGVTVDHFRITLSGIPSNWVKLPPEVQLMPSQQESVTVSIQPERSPKSQAGSYPITLQVTSRETANPVGRAQLSLIVMTFSQYSSRLHPEKIRAGKTASISVENQGNFPENFTLKLQDRENELNFKPSLTRVRIKEGERAGVNYHAQPRKRRWIGSQKIHPIEVQVCPTKGEPQELAGEVVSRALIPPWVPPLVIGILIMAAFFLWRWIAQPPRIVNVMIDPPNPVVGQPVTIHWDIERGENLEFRPLGTPMAAKAGEYTFQNGFPGRTDLTIIASNRFGSVQSILPIYPSTPTVIVTPTPVIPPPVIELWEVKPSQVQTGGEVTLRWRVSNADNVEIQPFGTVENEGVRKDIPRGDKTYTLVASNRVKTIKQSLEVIVATPQVPKPEIVDFSVSPNQVVLGGAVTIKWDVKNAESVSLEPLGTRPISGEEQYTPLEARIYEFVLLARSGSMEDRRVVQVAVKMPPSLTPKPPTPKPPTPKPPTPKPPTPSLVINPENLSRLVKNAPVSWSEATDFAWISGGPRFALGSERGIYVVDEKYQGGFVTAEVSHLLAASLYQSRLAWINQDNQVYWLDPSTGSGPILLDTAQDRVISLALSPDGTKLAYFSNTTLKLFDLTSGRLLKTWSMPRYVNQLSFSVSGAYMAAVDYDKFVIHIFRTDTGEEVVTDSWTSQASPELYGVGFSQDWKRAAWFARGTVQLMNLETGTLGPSLKPEEFVNAVAWSPDGKLLATSTGSSVIFWDPNSGEKLYTLGLSTPIRKLAFSKDGTMLGMLGTDGTVFIAEVAP